jgi:hypothetical protein
LERPAKGPPRRSELPGVATQQATWITLLALGIPRRAAWAEW